MSRALLAVLLVCGALACRQSPRTLLPMPIGAWRERRAADSLCYLQPRVGRRESHPFSYSVHRFTGTTRECLVREGPPPPILLNDRLLCPDSVPWAWGYGEPALNAVPPNRVTSTTVLRDSVSLARWRCWMGPHPVLHVVTTDSGGAHPR